MSQPLTKSSTIPPKRSVSKSSFSLWLSWPLVPALVMFIVFFVIPLVMMLGISFASRDTYGRIAWLWTLSNYERVFDPLYWTLYMRSAVLSVLTTGCCLVLGFPLAYAIARAPAHFQRVLLVLVMIPFWTSFLVRTYAWIFILRTEGLFNTILIKWGILTQPLEILYTNSAVLLGLVYGYLPFMVLPLYVVIERISPVLEEAAYDLYAGKWMMFRRIILPLAKPGIIGGCLLVFVPSLGAFITPYLLGGGKTMMLGTLIQHEFLVIRDWPFGSALSFILMAIVLVVLAGLVKRTSGIAPVA
ncbi:MAG: ABC transporter permease subunit [Nitrospirales bacterium]|nr:ABC transporter permease subunit [Nitrospirales bacterium]